MASQIAGLHYDSPVAFTARQRLVLSLGAPLIATSLRFLLRTCRYEHQGLDPGEDLQATHGRAIVAVWHESTTLAAYYYRNTGAHALVSNSFDGELGARTIQRLGILAIRGSSGSGGSQALRELATTLEHAGAVLLTLDGPRGPRRVAKPGAAVLAARTGASIIPHAFAVRRAWRLHSWDRFVIAKPFAHVISAHGPAIPPPDTTSPAAIEETRIQVESGLNQIHRQIERALGMETEELRGQSEEPVYAGTSSNR